LWAVKNLVWLEKPSLVLGADPPPTTPAYPNNSDSWILVDLPPDATQLEYGAEIYRLVCSPCHAYDGTGLTEDWRKTWNPEDQDCWQSKCHGYNHPSDGFFLPHSPPVVGPIIPALFETAYDLYIYNYETMPWHNPRSMNEKEVLAVTGYILQLNQIDPGQNLTLETAKNIRLRPQIVQIAITPDYTSTPRGTSTPEQERSTDSDNQIRPARTWLVGGIGLVIFIFAAIVISRISKN
jgi:hypothetical protein